jgi:hypothetical protein
VHRHARLILAVEGWRQIIEELAIQELPFRVAPADKGKAVMMKYVVVGRQHRIWLLCTPKTPCRKVGAGLCLLARVCYGIVIPVAKQR